MNVAVELAKLLLVGGVTIQVDPKSPDGEYYVQILRNKGSHEQLACGYYPAVDKGIADCLVQLKQMEKEVVFS